MKEIAKLTGFKDMMVVSRAIKKHNIPIHSKKLGKSDPKAKKFGEIYLSIVTARERRARLKKLEYNLSGEFLWELFLSQNRKCALSGIDIVFAKCHNRKDRYSMTASLDRIDSNKGYTQDNVQWVHKHINTMKMNVENQKFIELCKKIYKYSKKTGKIK